MSTPITERIEALLRKAESTEFEAEREAFSAKAEKLMIKYGIEMAQLDINGQKSSSSDKVITRTMEFTGIYQMANMRTAIRVAKSLGASGWYTDYRKFSGVVVVTIVDFESTMPNTFRLVESIVAQGEYALKFWWAANRLFFRQNDGYNARRSYLEGFGTGAAGRIESERQETVAEISGAGELVLVRSGQIDKVLKDNGIKTVRSRRRYTPDAGAAGRRDGQNAETGLRSKINS